jgi:hypothetical protein
MPLPLEPENVHPYDIDPAAAWYEWAEFREACDDQ